MASSDKTTTLTARKAAQAYADNLPEALLCEALITELAEALDAYAESRKQNYDGEIDQIKTSNRLQLEHINTLNSKLKLESRERHAMQKSFYELFDKTGMRPAGIAMDTIRVFGRLRAAEAMIDKLSAFVPLDNPLAAEINKFLVEK
jgi:hypothetical protein